MSVPQLRSTTYWCVVYLCAWYICTTIDAYQSRGAVVTASGQRDLKMGKKGKKHKEKETYLDDYYYDDSATTPPMNSNTTVTPSNTSLAPTPFVKSKKKKGKKGKKSKKKKKKSTKGDESLSPSPSPANVTTIAPMMVATTAPVAIATTAPAAVAAPTLNGTAATLTPTIQSKSKKKAKKSKKGGKGKGATDVPFQQAGSQVTHVPIASAPSPTTSRSKTAVVSKAPSINSTLTASIAPISKNATTTTKAPTSSKAVVASKTPIEAAPAVRAPAPIVPTTLFPSASPSPFPYEPLSASPIPTLMTETVDVSTFQLTYNISTTDKLETQQIDEAVDISFTFLNDYLMNAFDDNNRITYDSLIGTRIAHSIDYTTIQYMAAVRFVLVDQDSSPSLPATSDIDALIQMAFNPATVQVLLDLLRNLPASNPYSQTAAVVYASIEVETTSTTATDQPPAADSGKSVASTVGISGALLMICLCTGLVALHRWGYFTKFRRKKNKTNYHKAPTTSGSRSRSMQNESNRNADDIDNVNEDDDDDECASMSDCTSSVRSCPPSSSCTSSADESYRSKILEDDVEIKFLYPKTDGNMNCDVSIEDPLFPSSPLLSQDSDFGKKRHNV